MAETGPPGIYNVIAARSVAQRIKTLSSNLHTELRKWQDKGDFVVTFKDNPNILTGELQPTVEPIRTLRHAAHSSVSHASASIPSVSGFQVSVTEPERTYCMEPKRKFEHCKVQEIIRKHLEEKVKDQRYDREFCKEMSKVLAEKIKEEVKSLQFTRYKIISIVTMGQKRGQTVRMASRCVWDERFDNFAECTVESEDIYATGLVYGIFYE